MRGSRGTTPYNARTLPRNASLGPPGAGLAATALLLAPAGAARAEVPLPAYPGCGDSEDLSLCPDEADDWTHWGFTPASLLGRIREAEIPLGIGNNSLQAWQFGSGHWEDLVAVADSGIDWGEPDLDEKVFLNVGELPLPQDADGTPASDHDLDGNGLVNLWDFALDPRVSIDAGDFRTDDRLDPSDLIATFSDGIDDDGNGYVDDIAGWDFFEQDNDPFSTNVDGYGDHGTGVAREAAGAGNNGGRIGSCPNCALLPIRVGDSFITNGAIVTDAVVFALTHHAASMTMALGGMTNPDSLTAAMKLAWESNLVIVAASGDETSFHRNYPAVNEHALYVHSIRGDQEDWADSSTFLRFVNCNNFGPRNELVAATRNSCATGAVAYIAGAAALLRSLGREYLGRELAAPEIYQALVSTADDVDVEESRASPPDPDVFPSYPGWDQFFGHGRIDLGAAARAVVQDDLPPIATIETPGWFEFLPRQYLDGDRGFHPGETELEIRGVAGSGAGAANPVDFVLDWGLGSDVPETSWREISRGEGESLDERPLGRLRIGQIVGQQQGCGSSEVVPYVSSDLLRNVGVDPAYRCPPLVAGDGIMGRADKLDPYGITLRLTVTDASGRVATHRKHVYVREDERLLSGFPRRLTGSLETAPALADFDGDGDWEIAIAGADGTVHLIGGDGEELPGWPRQVGLQPGMDPSNPENHLDAPPLLDGSLAATGRQAILASVAAGALDGSGPPDVVVGTLDGWLWAWRADGSLRPGFPVSMDFANCDPALRDDSHRYDCGFFAAPTLTNLDGDAAGTLEIVQPAMDQWLYVWDGAGQAVAPYPVKVQDPSFEAIAGREGRILSSPAVGDIDADGDPDFVLGTSQTAGSDFGGYGMLYALDARAAALLPGWPLPIFAGFAGALPYIGEGVVVAPALADVDGDGDLEIGANAIAEQGALYDHTGAIARDFSAVSASYGAQSNTSEPAALFLVGNGAFGDADGDGTPDWFAGGSGINYGLNIAAWAVRFEHDHLLLGYSGRPDSDDGVTSRPLPGFPRQMEDMQFFGGPLLLDLTGDGAMEVVEGSTGLLRAFSADGSEPGGGFPFFHGGWQLAAPAAGDVDGDGWRDLVLGTREGYLFAWRTESRADQPADWLMFKHDAARSGNLHVAVPLQAGPEEEEGDEGGTDCGVGRSASSGGATAGFVAALAGAGLVSRRRRAETPG
jgi:hypothetical protein